MKRVCSWCKKVLGEKPGKGTTHTMCEPCRDKFFDNTPKKVHNMYERTTRMERGSGETFVCDECGTKLPRDAGFCSSLGRSLCVCCLPKRGKMAGSGFMERVK